MSTRLAALLALATALAAPALAQETASEDAAATEASANDAPVAATGEAAAAGEEGEAPRIYVREEHGDWEVRCLEAPEGQDDPCQLYQRLADEQGNPTADVNFFDVNEGEATAGATILTPLRTLLTAGVGIQIDGGEPRRYPFTFCDASGCYARLGFSEGDLNRFRRGANAIVTVVPAVAPDQPARLTMSLSGFTAGFAAVDGTAN